MKNSHIEWTDHTFNPWEGCTKVSPGCAHCYAEARNQRFAGGANWGPGAPRRRTVASNWNQPRAWNRLQESSGAVHHGAARPRVFCASLADWLDDEVPHSWRADLLNLIHECQHLDWLLLTKRPENWARLVRECVPSNPDAFGMRMAWLNGHAPANVWIGTTVEDQPRAEDRIPALLKIPAKVRFLSCEPLLGPLSLYGDGSQACDRCGGDGCDPELWHPDRHPIQMDPDPCRKCCLIARGIHWLICGGESGRGARPMRADWARALRDQAKAAGVAFHFKQWGSHDANGVPCNKVESGRLLDGVEWNELPTP